MKRFACCVKHMGSLPVLPLSPRHHLVDAMTGWLKSDPALPEGFGIGCVADLQQGNTEAVRIKDSGSVQLSGITTTALADGHQCSQLNLSWQGKIGFTLHHDCRITGISMPDEYCELLSGGENHLADADTNFVLATGIMTEFVAQFRQLIQDDNLGEVVEEQITADPCSPAIENVRTGQGEFSGADANRRDGCHRVGVCRP